MLYVSDHGEDIFDDSRLRFLHASPTPTYWQLHVPIVLWMSDSFKDAHPEKYRAAEANTKKKRIIKPERVQHNAFACGNQRQEIHARSIPVG